ncbi:hypothetical protein OR1_03614 [Geobacter sp. OR-1]|uniref:SPASM domain-containing protein n=1 Tax=Geobacter sp. OR-1 TaxID=1266765 RepID=UPI000541DE0E|nr:SPASM domain-containing protein [Geobacter sp. OR-1]GAM11302.1 hypothetical protein OR1_03614 [Geobacter sp. OR-1]
MELRSPIRLYWDITPLPCPLPDYERICSELSDSRALTLHITDLGTGLSAETLDVVARLSRSPLFLFLTASHAALAEALPLKHSGVKKVYADIRAPEELADFGSAGINGVSFRTSRSNFLMIPDIIAGCIDNGIAELQLPMERLVSGDDPLCLSVGEREALAGKIAAVRFAGKLTVTANDPFLWRVVHPGTPFPDGVCQAGNTMLAIAPNGDVYPCPAMPAILGNLQVTAYRDIVASRIKKELRAGILSRPAVCADCFAADDCRGGCRGRGLFAQGTLDASDPGCGISTGAPSEGMPDTLPL